MTPSSRSPERRRRSYSPLDPTTRRVGSRPSATRAQDATARPTFGTRSVSQTHTSGARRTHVPSRFSGGRSHAPKTPPQSVHSTRPATLQNRAPTRRAGVRQSSNRGGSTHGRGAMPRPRNRSTLPANGKKDDLIPALAPGDIRIIPLGGVEEIGRNMTAIEIGNDILVIDCGFQFKEVETPGIDYILPNTKYLEDNKDRVRALLVTHGHLDHIGAVPFLIDRIGMPPIYTRNLTALMIKKRQAEFPHIPPLDYRVVEKSDRVKIGQLAVRFFGVTHTIPDSMGIIIETPYGNIVIPSDYKLEHIDGIPSTREEENYAFFEKEHTLLLLLDSTNVENPGFSTPEQYVMEGLDQYIRDTKGRLIIGTFASQMERMVNIIESAVKYGRKVAVEGRSMKTNIEIAKLAGLLKVKDDAFIPSGAIGDYPKDKILVLSTGAQGEEFAAMMRMANKTHKFISIEKGDTVLLSASIVPGNEKSVEKLKDNIARAGGKIISYRTSDIYVHSTGHGNREELAWLHKKIQPTFFMPIHGNHYRLRIHADLAEELGMQRDHIIVPDNSSIIEIQDHGTSFVKLPVKAPAGLRMVDGLSVGDMQEVVLKDRQALADDGMFVVIALLNSKTGKLRKSPDIISRGFVYLRESQDLLAETRTIAKKTVELAATRSNPINFDFIRKELTDEVTRFLYQKTNKHPIVIPVLIGV